MLVRQSVKYWYTATSQRSWNTQQYRKEGHLILFSVFYIFFFWHYFFLLSLCKISCTREASCQKSMLYILYFEFLLYNVLHSVGNIFWRKFLRGLLLLLFPTKSAIAKESLVLYSLTQRAPETQPLLLWH